MDESEDLWRCGVCGEIRRGNWGLLPVIGPTGWRWIACPDCRDSYPELRIAPDGEMWADYPAPLMDDDEGLPFGLDDLLNTE